MKHLQDLGLLAREYMVDSITETICSEIIRLSKTFDCIELALDILEIHDILDFQDNEIISRANVENTCLDYLMNSNSLTNQKVQKLLKERKTLTPQLQIFLKGIAMENHMNEIEGQVTIREPDFEQLRRIADDMINYGLNRNSSSNSLRS